MGADHRQDVMVLAGRVEQVQAEMVELHDRRPVDRSLGTKDSSELVDSSTCQQR